MYPIHKRFHSWVHIFIQLNKIQERKQVSHTEEGRGHQTALCPLEESVGMSGMWNDQQRWVGLVSKGHWFYKPLIFMLTDEHHPAGLVQYLSKIQIKAQTDVCYCSRGRREHCECSTHSDVLAWSSRAWSWGSNYQMYGVRSRTLSKSLLARTRCL